MRLVFALIGSLADATTYIEPVFWNVENPRFLQNYTRHVELQQKMDIFCPQKMEMNPTGWSNSKSESQSLSHHFQTIYMVDEQSYESCMLNVRVAKKLMTCKTPDVEKKYTIIFQEVNPNPFGIEFQADKVYYFISTSVGTDHSGLDNTEQGVCASKQMRMKIQVHSNGMTNSAVRAAAYMSEEPLLEIAESEIEDRSLSEKSNFIVFNNFLIIGIVLGVILVLMIILIGFLTRRSFQRRKNMSYPTLSDYQSSYVESDYPTSNDLVRTCSQPSRDTIQEELYDFKEKHSKKCDASEEFSYIDGRFINQNISNRTNDVIVI